MTDIDLRWCDRCRTWVPEYALIDEPHLGMAAHWAVAENVIAHRAQFEVRDQMKWAETPCAATGTETRP